MSARRRPQAKQPNGQQTRGVKVRGDATDAIIVAGDYNTIADHRGNRNVDDALRLYLQDRFKKEYNVRFKQAELETQAVHHLFVDVHLTRWRSYAEPVGAALRLLRGNYTALALNAGPGQGKSTVLQFVCQVLRAKYLDEKQYLAELPEQYVRTANAVPLKVELRDYASWVAGVDPFDVTQQRKSLPDFESFLCHSISSRTGGLEFSTADLRDVFSRHDIFLALDGVDEIADLEARRQVLDLVVEGLDRLADAQRQVTQRHSEPLTTRVVITSRPSAHPAAPQIPQRFDAYHLAELDGSQRDEYLRKWTRYRNLSDDDLSSLLETWDSKKDDPHVYDLSRTPMQLAIVLHLMHTKGISLPSQRTRLYETYIDVYFDREAAKDADIQNHRGLLLGIHSMVAWTLHSHAERFSSAGRIERGALENLIREYLVDLDADTSLADDLFKAVDRVWLLFSIVEGTFEFQVQPVREYFAARYLYSTVPLRHAATDGKAARFQELVSRPYWLNTMRFYAGMFSEGEVADINELIADVLEQPGMRHALHIRQVIMHLIADRVYDPKPRVAKRAVRSGLDGLGVRAYASEEGSIPRVPTDMHSMLEEHMKGLVEAHLGSPGALDAAKVLAVGDLKRHSHWWFGLPPSQAKIEIGSEIGLFRVLPAQDSAAYVPQDGDPYVSAALVLGGYSPRTSSALHVRMTQACLDGHLSGDWTRLTENPLFARYALLAPEVWRLEPNDTRLRRELKKAAKSARGTPLQGLHDVLQSAIKTTPRRVEALPPETWRQVLLAADDAVADCWLTRELVALARDHVTVENFRRTDRPYLFKKSDAPIMFRLMRLRLMVGNAESWRRELYVLDEAVDLAYWCLCLAVYGHGRVLIELQQSLAEVLDLLPPAWRSTLGRATREAARWRSAPISFTSVAFASLRFPPQVLALLLPLSGAERVAFRRELTATPASIELASEFGPEMRAEVATHLAEVKASDEQWLAIKGDFAADVLPSRSAAEAVLAEPMVYPRQLVLSSEAAWTSQAFSAKSSLAKQAEELRWAMRPADY